MWHLYHQRNLVMQIWKRKCFVECRKTNYLSVDCSLRYLLFKKTTLTWIINFLYGLPSYLVSKAGKCRDVDIDTTLVWRDSVSCRRLVASWNQRSVRIWFSPIKINWEKKLRKFLMSLSASYFPFIMVGYIFLGDREEVMYESVLSSKSSHRAATISWSDHMIKKVKKII